MELHTPHGVPDGEGLDGAPVRSGEDLDRPALVAVREVGDLPPVPREGRRARPESPEQATAVSIAACRPNRHEAHLRSARYAAHTSSDRHPEQLGAEADSEGRHVGGDGVSKQIAGRRQPRSADIIVRVHAAAEDDEAVGPGQGVRDCAAAARSDRLHVDAGCRQAIADERGVDVRLVLDDEDGLPVMTWSTGVHRSSVAGRSVDDTCTWEHGPMTDMRPRAVDDLDSLLSVDHPVLTYDIGSGFTPPAYVLGSLAESGAVAVQRRSDRGHPGLAVIGSADAVRGLLLSEEVRDLVRLRDLTHVSVPRAAFEHIADVHDWGGGGEWDWMWTTTGVPTLPHESGIEIVDSATRGELVEFLRQANPRTHGEPFARPDQLWVTLREGDTLIACGSWDLATSGIPVLAGIAVDPARRGEGYGAAITAYLTRKAVATFGACTLGMFADNVTARRLYHRLGYRTGAQWSSRWFAHDPVVEHAPGRDRPSGRSPGRRTAVAP